MKLSALLSVFVLVSTAASPGFGADSPQIRSPAPVRNFSLPFFNEAGFRTMLIRGNEALLTDLHRPQLKDVTVSIFVGDASNRIETVILSTEATVDTTTSIVEGTGPVRLVRDDIEATGERWRYEYANIDEKHAPIKILIERNVRIVVRAELQPLLK